jgi:hypothetical protein
MYIGSSIAMFEYHRVTDTVSVCTSRVAQQIWIHIFAVYGVYIIYIYTTYVYLYMFFRRTMLEVGEFQLGEVDLLSHPGTKFCKA